MRIKKGENLPKQNKPERPDKLTGLLINFGAEVGVAPTRAQGPLDFESSASTSFTSLVAVQSGIFLDKSSLARIL